ncbi:MAG TPA: twin-arginine translocase TatA/TatE family subunit [Pyrinomonadaceae bacterium]|nr:twin-arginine translocase TatA/TatE family subunit [Pyrinomonadaceae bacterium]
MFALIFESLSTTELLFILVIALIFFGPRKLPQLARSMGKGLAEFRKASDDFKRTWEREVAMEAAKLETEIENTINFDEQPQPYLQEDVTPVEENVPSISENAMSEPLVKAPEPELVVARGSAPESVFQPEPLSQTAEPLTPAAEPAAPGPFRKQDWL